MHCNPNLSRPFHTLQTQSTLATSQDQQEERRRRCHAKRTPPNSTLISLAHKGTQLPEPRPDPISACNFSGTTRAASRVCGGWRGALSNRWSGIIEGEADERERGKSSSLSPPLLRSPPCHLVITAATTANGRRRKLNDSANTTPRRGGGGKHCTAHGKLRGRTGGRGREGK